IHHRLVDMGFSQKQTVFILYAISGVLGLAAVVLAESSALRTLILLICVLVFVFGGSVLTKRKEHFEEMIAAQEAKKSDDNVQMTVQDIEITEENEELGGDDNAKEN
ncbi:MAG: undecaprenyl/decaprenyl-phosphate alpha-N-acetylglucosaminyl 1-phosphate transferase, partial [Clostridia bacterium]|nr:undecaprenyl/decaprenyl-phosphate alpha-N-acetylglucosaminyl 1-phosphate transferase [Clostridia bacterium]